MTLSFHPGFNLGKQHLNLTAFFPPKVEKSSSSGRVSDAEGHNLPFFSNSIQLLHFEISQLVIKCIPYIFRAEERSSPKINTTEGIFFWFLFTLGY